MDWGAYRELSRRWHEDGAAYIHDCKAYESEWERLGTRPEKAEPADARASYPDQVLDIVRAANASDDLPTLRRMFPPAHSPVLQLLKANGQSVEPMWIDEPRVAVRIGGASEPRIGIATESRVEPISNLIAVGRSPCGQYVAKATAEEITIHKGWDGRVTSRLNWSMKRKKLPSGLSYPFGNQSPPIEVLFPLPDGESAIVVTEVGIFVLGPAGIASIHPEEESLAAAAQDLNAEGRDASDAFRIDMAHAAVSPDGRWIAVGNQSGDHRILNGRYEAVASIGAKSEYPHFAIFSHDSRQVALNSCHMYWGQTLGVPTTSIEGSDTPEYDLHPGHVLLDDGSRVYAGSTRAAGYFFGDAGGHVRARGFAGEKLGDHHIGSTICAIDTSPDGTRLVVGSYAGFLCMLEIDAGFTDPLAHGDATHRELWRWLFWKGEPRPLRW